MSSAHLPRILVLLGLVVMTFGIFAASVAADAPALPATLTATALGAISVGAVIVVIGIQSFAAKRNKATSFKVREPQRPPRIVFTSFRRSGVIIVLLGLLIVFFLGDQLARTLAPLLGPGFIAAWLVDVTLLWFLRTRHSIDLRQ